MSEPRSIVLDANILLRAVLGNRVRHLLDAYEDTASFFTPDHCFVEAQRNLIAISEERRLDLAANLTSLGQLERLVWAVDAADYRDLEDRALARIASRDTSDWPIIAVALFLDCPIWTEDRDFFGTGVATWTSDRVELYLRGD